MGRRAALIALLGGAAVVVLIILLSGGGDEQPSTGASATAPAQGRTQTGVPGAAGAGGTAAQGSSTARRRAQEQARREARARRRASRLEQGRLGAQTGGAPPQGSRGETAAGGASVATIEVVGGAAVGGSQKVRFPKNDRVRLIVHSDTDQVVEIPGYGLKRRVQAGGSARFYFQASRQGLFEIQLERGRTLIGVLEVG